MAIGATAPVDRALAGVGSYAVPIALAGDGNVYSAFPAGDVEPPPPYEALAWTGVPAAMSACGFATLVHGTADDCDLRTANLLGTNADNDPDDAVIAIFDETGDDATDAGITIPSAGLGDGPEFSSTSNTDKSGTFRLSVDDGTSVSNTNPISWAMTATGGGGGDPEVSDRDISLEADFSSGAINASGHTESIYGRTILKDSFNPILLDVDSTFTINAIPNSATGTFTWNAGTGPSNREGFTIGNATGMNEVDNRLFRGLSLTGAGTSSGSGQLWQDGDDDGCCIPSSWGTNGTPELPTDRADTSGYGTFSGTVTATTYKKSNYANGCCGTSDTNDVHVVEDGFVPPSNLNGTADPVDALRGTHFLSTRIDYWKDYTVWNNAATAGYQNHRWSLSTNASSFDPYARIVYNQEFWISWAIYLPSNYDSNDLNATTNTSMSHTSLETFLMGEVDNGDEGFIAQFIAGGPGTPNVDQWFMGVHTPTGSGGTATITNRVAIGSVAGDIGHWTCWIVNALPNITTGFYKVWKHSHCEDNDPADIALVINQTGGTADEVFTSSEWAINPRMYKFGWNNNVNSTPSTVIWLGYDEIRFGSVPLQGTTFSDVHPHGLSEP